MQIEKRQIENLAYDPNNARTHNQKNLDAIKGSLAKFGQQKPIVVDSSNVVIAGNGTLQAAKELGWSEIDVVVTSLDKFDKTAFALADNRTAELAEWDGLTLEKSLQALKGVDFDISDIGFDDFDFEKDDVSSEGSHSKIEGSKELTEDDFSTFDHQCPKCGFEFDDKK